MGTKRTGHRKYLFLYLACGVALLVTGNACRSYTETRPNKEAPVAGHIGSVSQNTPNIPAAEPVFNEATGQHLNAAYLALAEGNYTTAASEIQMASIDTLPNFRTETIYLTGLMYADPENPTGDMTKACETFQRIEKEHPDSDRAGEVRIFIDLLQAQQSIETENQSLHQEISQLKKKLAAEQNSVQRLKSLLNKMKEIDLGLMPEEQ